MHIHSIRICGWKSYKDETFIGPFHEGLNVVVGRNGSGKSNLLEAVRLLLGDAGPGLNAEQRSALLHEGPSGRVLSAFIEVTFDNSDGRLPIERSRVVLRRMFGLQKDEYLLDRRSVSRAEVAALFESAGFSRSNPYYIVQQGKVAALCTMKDDQRLELLKEIAGTRTYEEKRAESLRILEESIGKRAKIREILEYIEKRLQELENEKEQLVAYQQVDRERRSLERAIYERELTELKTQLESLEHERQHEGVQLGKMHQECRRLEVELEEIEQRIAEIERERARLEVDQSSVKLELVKAAEQRSALETELALVTQQLENETIELDRVEQKIQTLRQAAQQRRAERDRILPEYERLREQEQHLRTAMAMTQQELVQLQARETRDVQFRTVDECNAWFHNEIARNEELRHETRSQLQETEREIHRLEFELSSIAERRKTNETQFASDREQLNALNARLAELKRERNEAHRARQELWRREAELESSRATLLSELTESERRKRMSVGSKFLNAYQYICNLQHSGMIYGPLYTLFETDEKFYVAVEAAMGSALCYIVVDTDETAAYLIQRLREANAGRLTFIPLNRVRDDASDAAKRNSMSPPPTEEAVPLVSRLRLRDERFSPVFERVVAGTLIARSILIASKLARGYNVPCVTLEGDLVNKRGAMHGGYTDRRQSRLASLLRYDKIRIRIQQIESEREQIRAQLAALESQIQRTMNELQKSEAEKRNLFNQLRDHQRALTQLDREKLSIEAALETERQRMQTLQRHVHEYELVLSSLRDEFSERTAALSSSSSSPTPQTAISADAFVARLAALEKELESVAAARATLEQRLVEIESELETCIERQLRELEKRFLRETFEDAPELFDSAPGISVPVALQSDPDEAPPSIAELQTRQTSLRRELETLGSVLQAQRVSQDRIAEALQRTATELDALARKRDSLEAQLPVAKEALATESQRLQIHVARHTHLQQRKAETERKLRELGPAPAQHHELAHVPLTTLMQRLEATNTRLSQLGQVNQKALEQYLVFANQREELRTRLEELDRGDDSIRTLIHTLDHRRANDLQRTFKGIARLFSAVFAELVPGGTAQLVMQRGPHPTASDTTDTNVDFAGVAIRVRFPSEDHFSLMATLSGGQKTLVALALILAIQRLDPAPFYLFDEIDASLDAASRERIAALLQQRQPGPDAGHGTEASAARSSVSRPQLILTTFRPELVRVADRCYGVTIRGRVSCVEPVSVAEALAFVTGPASLPIDATNEQVAILAPTGDTESGTAPDMQPVAGGERTSLLQASYE